MYKRLKEYTSTMQLISGIY